MSESENKNCKHENKLPMSTPGMWVCKDCGVMLTADEEADTLILTEYNLSVQQMS